MVAAVIGAVGTLYRFKLHMFLGSVRRQPAVAAAFALLALLFLPGAFGVGYFLPDTGFAAGGNLAELASLMLSIFAAFLIVSAPGGGLLLQPAEVDFVAVAPLTVHQLVLADLLFQLTVYGIGLPAVALVAAGYTVRVGAPVWAFLVPVAAITVLAVIVILVVQTLGIARILHRRWAIPAAGFAAAALLAPALLRFAFHLPAAYASLPYPTTAAAQLALLPFGMGDWLGFPVLALYAAVALVGHAWATRRSSLPNLRGTFAFAFGLEGKRRQQEALLRVFGRLRPTRGSQLYRRTMSGTMAMLHFVRMTRDGTLIMSAVFAVVFGVPFLSVGGGFGTGGGAYVATILPVVAVAQWMITDRSNLWVVLASGRPPQSFFLGWWAALVGVVALISGALSLLAGLVSGRLDGVAIAAAIGGALGASAGAVISAARFPYAPNELSLRPILHFLLAGLGAALGASPAYAIGLVLGEFPPAFFGAAAAALLGVAYLCSVIVGRSTRHPVL